MRDSTKARLKNSPAGPVMKAVLTVGRRVLVYPLRRRRNWVANLYRYRLASAWLKGIRRYGWGTRATLGFTPDQPNMTSQIQRIMLLNRYTHVKPGAGVPDLAIYWAYGAWDKAPSTDWILSVNARCRDISKAHLEAVHREIFGYGLAVDPVTYRGAAWEKSDDNAFHDGHIVDLPLLQPSPNAVYQRVVDNAQPDGTREDIRVPIVGDHVPFVYLVYRTLDPAISGKVLAKSRKVPVGDVITPQEVDSLLRMCRRVGLDFGEVDALRDRVTGQLFIVDLNRAVGASILPPEDRFWEQLIEIADLFDSTFVAPRM